MSESGSGFCWSLRTSVEESFESFWFTHPVPVTVGLCDRRPGQSSLVLKSRIGARAPGAVSEITLTTSVLNFVNKRSERPHITEITWFVIGYSESGPCAESRGCRTMF